MHKLRKLKIEAIIGVTFVIFAVSFFIIFSIVLFLSQLDTTLIGGLLFFYMGLILSLIASGLLADYRFRKIAIKNAIEAGYYPHIEDEKDMEKYKR